MRYALFGRCWVTNRVTDYDDEPFPNDGLSWYRFWNPEEQRHNRMPARAADEVLEFSHGEWPMGSRWAPR